jgi:hypothetical protein
MEKKEHDNPHTLRETGRDASSHVKRHKLGVEIDCDRFHQAMNYVTTAHAVPVSTRKSAQNIAVDDMNPSTSKHSFISCMGTVGRFSRENYTLRFVNEDGTVALHTRTIFGKL